MSGATRQNATASTQGTIHHLCVAVQKCFDLRSGQTLLIEELGDVTVEQSEQVEVKQYSDRLTDGHHNFWNTLRNWMDTGFDAGAYKALILHTTQFFGENARLKEWNKTPEDRRIEILVEIYSEFEKAFANKKAKDPHALPSPVLIYQRFVMDASRRKDLKTIISKVFIEACQPITSDLYSELLETRAQGVLENKRTDFLNSLIGFICKADKNAGERWEINYAQWTAKYRDLISTYCRDTHRFPRKHFNPDSQLIPGTKECQELFVKKIRDIEYESEVINAVHDFEATVKTISDEFRSYAVDPVNIKSYENTIENRFRRRYSIACREGNDTLHDSRNLYDEVLSSPPPPFPGFDDVHDGFRNGILHMGMNDEQKKLEWRVKRIE